MNIFDNVIKTYNLEKLPFKIWEYHKAIKEFEAKGFLLDIDSFEIQGNLNEGGIYRIYNEADEIIYVGKSNNIHRRLLEHMGKRSNTAYFIDEAYKIEYHVNNDPVFQTMLEGIFIAYHAPKYNDEVKDRSKQK